MLPKKIDSGHFVKYFFISEMPWGYDKLLSVK